MAKDEAGIPKAEVVKVISPMPYYRLGISSAESALVEKSPGKFIRVETKAGEGLAFHKHVVFVDQETAKVVKKSFAYGIDFLTLEDWKAMYKNKDTREAARKFRDQLERRTQYNDKKSEQALEDMVEAIFETQV